jgi:hypothetical protein
MTNLHTTAHKASAAAAALFNHLNRVMPRTKVVESGGEPPAHLLVSDDVLLENLECLAEPGILVPDPHGAVDANGQPVMRSVNELMNEADAEIKAAQEIEGCATGANDEGE